MDCLEIAPVTPDQLEWAKREIELREGEDWVLENGDEEHVERIRQARKHRRWAGKMAGAACKRAIRAARGMML